MVDTDIDNCMINNIACVVSCMRHKLRHLNQLQNHFHRSNTHPVGTCIAIGTHVPLKTALFLRRALVFNNNNTFQGGTVTKLYA